MCVTTSQYEISSKNSHLLSQKVFLWSIIYPSEKTIHWNKQHFGMRYPPPLFLHHVSTIKHYWSIEHCLLLLLFLTLFLHYFCFCSFLIIKKTVHGPGPWQGVHGPGPKWGSMDPWSMFCPHPFQSPSYNQCDCKLLLISSLWLFHTGFSLFLK